jgi:hypothetical protein
LLDATPASEASSTGAPATALEIASFRSRAWTKGLTSVREARNTKNLTWGVELSIGIEVQPKVRLSLDQNTIRVLRMVLGLISRKCYVVIAIE